MHGRDELIGERRRLHNEEHYNLLSLYDIFRVNTLRRIKCVGTKKYIQNFGCNVS
jgi:hypothetical protein